MRGPQYHACGRDRLFCSASGGSRHGRDRHDGVRSDDGLPRRPRRRAYRPIRLRSHFPPSSSPFLIDMSTATVAMGKVLNARDAGRQVPLDWGIDTDGRPTTDPKQISTLLPLGGPKGSGLSFMIECLCSLTLSATRSSRKRSSRRRQPGKPVSQRRGNRDRSFGIRRCRSNSGARPSGSEWPSPHCPWRTRRASCFPANAATASCRNASERHPDSVGNLVSLARGRGETRRWSSELAHGHAAFRLS